MDLDVSGLRVRFDDVPTEVAVILRDLWSEYLVPADDQPVYLVRIEEGPRDLSPGRVLPAEVAIARTGSGMRYTRDEVELTVEESSTDARMVLSRGDPKRRAWGIANLLGAVLAWHLARRGGGALHAAGIVVEGRAFLLVGAEGSGKSTFARIASEQGAIVLSDDVVLVDAEGERLFALASPLRDRPFRAPGPGRWPLRALLLPARGTPPRLDPVSRLNVESALAANLLFLSRALNSGSRGALALERIAGRASAYRLTFSPEPSFLALLESLAPQQ